MHALVQWLGQRDIRCRQQRFTLYPHYFEAIGAWFILSRALLALSVWLRWGWPSLLIAVLAVLGGTLDKVFLWPVVSWHGKRAGVNLLIEFEPQEAAAQELILAAHYDSKTELLDHNRRMFFLRRLPLSLGLTLLVGCLAAAGSLLAAAGHPWAAALYGLAGLLALPMLFFGWGLGGYLALGRFVPPSQGAVDNGAACAVLLRLAERLSRRETCPRRTRVTIALFGGEEVNMQGSRAYVRGRDWPLPAAALNLEVLGQDGGYIYFERDGDAVRWRPTSGHLNALLAETVAGVAGQAPQPAPALNSDAFSFLRAGIPAAVLATYDSRLLGGGFHSAADNIGRIHWPRLPEAEEILARFVMAYDA